MRILIGCEYSNVVAGQFRLLGHDVTSCDYLPNDVTQLNHYQGNIFDLFIFHWDMLIVFPPCTHLSLSGGRWFEKKRIDGRQQAGIDFFIRLTKTGIRKVCIENPIGIMSSHYRKPDQIVNPFDFGDPARKPTCFWLSGLPKLQATNLGDAPLFGEMLNRGEFCVSKSGQTIPSWYNNLPSLDRGKKRSLFFTGMAQAMAHQWGTRY